MSRSADDRSSEHEGRLSALQLRIKELEVELQAKATEVASLQEKLNQTPPAASISDEDVETIRKDAIAFQAQQHAEMENELKKLRARPSKDELMKLREKLSDAQRLADTRHQDVESLSVQLENQKSALSTAQGLADSRQQDLDSLNRQLEIEKREFENKLGARPTEEGLASIKEQLSEAQRLANARQQDIDSTNLQLENERLALSAAQRLADSRQQDLDKLNERLMNEKRVFENKLGARPSPEELSSIKEQLSAAQQLANSKQEDVSVLNIELEKERGKNQKLEAGLEQYKTNSHKAVADEKELGDKRVEALQQRLKQTQKDLQIKQDDEEEFRSKVEKSWQEEQAKFEEERASLRKAIEEARQPPPQVVVVQSAEQTTEQRDTRSESPVVQESQQDDDLPPPFAKFDARRDHPNYADTQDAHNYLEDTISRNDHEDEANRFKYLKPKAAPNSSSKRATTSKLQSSSPGFMSSQKRRKSTTYGGASSGHKRRLSQGKEPTKRKADTGQVVEGYEEERKKRMKPAAAAPSRPTLRSQGQRAPTMPTTSVDRAPPSSQGSLRGRLGRSKTDEMNARFAQELSTNKGGQTAANFRMRQK